jgi:DNA-binding response OmpR family regulator
MAVVLVAKEDTEFLALLKLYLADEFGHAMHVAHTAAEARERLPVIRPDVLLLGHTLRDEMTPNEVRHLSPKTKVVLYSVDEAHLSAASARSIYAADAALSRLADFKELDALIRELCETTRADTR